MVRKLSENAPDKAGAPGGFLVMGADVAPTRVGCVVLDPSGAIVATHYTAKTKKEASLPGGTWLPRRFGQMKEPGKRNALRLLWMTHWMNRVLVSSCDTLVDLFGPFGILYVCVEDYALHKPEKAHMVGEAGGVFRVLALYRRQVRLRLHDPVTVKMFATGRGDLWDKEDMAKAVKEKWEVDFSRHGKEPGEDLTDAYALARMGLLEVRVRKGLVALSECREEEIKVFNRCTSVYPVNVLARDWIGGDDEGA